MESQEEIIQELKRGIDNLFAVARSRKMKPEQLKDYAEKVSRFSDELLTYTTTAVDNILLCDIRAIFPGLSYNPAPEPWTKRCVEVTLPKEVQKDLASSWSFSRIYVKDLFIHVQQALSRPRMTPDAFEILYLENRQELRYTNITKTHRWSLYGTPDYIICSGTGANKVQHLVLDHSYPLSVEKRRSQMLAYMAIIHMNLKSRAKHGCTVYGVSPASKKLYFYQIDPRRKWSETCYTSEDTNVQTIINLFATLLTRASATALENIIPDDHTPSQWSSDDEDSIKVDSSTGKSH